MFIKSLYLCNGMGRVCEMLNFALNFLRDLHRWMFVFRFLCCLGNFWFSIYIQYTFMCVCICARMYFVWKYCDVVHRPLTDANKMVTYKNMCHFIWFLLLSKTWRVRISKLCVLWTLGVLFDGPGENNPWACNVAP